MAPGDSISGKVRILIDMDGVLCDWERKLLREPYFTTVITAQFQLIFLNITKNSGLEDLSFHWKIEKHFLFEMIIKISWESPIPTKFMNKKDGF